MELSDETKAFIIAHQHDDVRKLALKARNFPLVNMSQAITQIAGKQVIAKKIPSWSKVDELLFPPHLPLEQCSSEATARYKASLIEGNTLVDLTGGFGVDCAFLSANFAQIYYVERQKELAELVQQNFRTLGLNHITIVNQDSVAFLDQMLPADCIYIDPARRDTHGGKIVGVADCEPDVGALEHALLAKAKRVLIKLSPMLDIAAALQTLSHTVAVHVVSVQNECKELLLLLEQEPCENESVTCVNITKEGRQTFAFTYKEEREATCAYASDVKEYLYEPTASILKAGAFKTVACRFNLEKLHPSSHLYTSNKLIKDFPGRVFLVISVSSVKEKSLSELKKANIATRNFPLTTNELRKKLKLTEGGDHYIFGTTLNSQKRVIVVCEKVN
ncbi:SAM-dependent methyltransferase [Bacteroides sp. 214]|uniref:class I SAM-dependent methyltransferase n=1 Tax=Bacteroides sp. 214 TaxID=2302935 RepID=UPI0013D6309D|nr:RsmD family RNA methyltransferase [Bacteroides sp. 214]NDW13268.1 SAM-dependent methyltransferase [Bacteroides sp. 214]